MIREADADSHFLGSGGSETQVDVVVSKDGLCVAELRKLLIGGD